MKKRIIVIILIGIVILKIAFVIPQRATDIADSISENWNIELPEGAHAVYEKSNMMIDGQKYVILKYDNNTSIEKWFEWTAITDEEREMSESFFDILKIPHFVRPDYEKCQVYKKEDRDDTILFYMQGDNRLRILEIWF